MLAPKTEEKEKKPFSFTDVLDGLQVYEKALSTNSEKTSLYFAVSKAKKYSIKDYIIGMRVNNPVDENVLNLNKYDIVSYLKNKLGYDFFKLEISREQTETQSVAYSPMDKFFALKKNFPDIELLKKAFDADITY